MSHKLLTADVAEILGVTPSRVGQLVAEGKLAAAVVGRRSPIHVFDAAEVERLAGARDSAKLDRAARRYS